MQVRKSLASTSLAVAFAVLPGACAESPTAAAAFNQYLGKTCSGAFQLGSSSQTSTWSITTKWFRKPDGSSWVHLLLGRRDWVDRPFHPTETGIYYTGEHGGQGQFSL